MISLLPVLKYSMENLVGEDIAFIGPNHHKCLRPIFSCYLRDQFLHAKENYGLKIDEKDVLITKIFDATR